MTDKVDAIIHKIVNNGDKDAMRELMQNFTTQDVAYAKTIIKEINTVHSHTSELVNILRFIYTVRSGGKNMYNVGESYVE